jgi:hypothetical protein
MSLSHDWKRYIATISKNAPEYPIVGATAFQLNQQAANRVSSVCSSLLDGLGRGLPPHVSLALGLATASDGAGRRDAVVDAAIAWGASTLFGAASAATIGGVVALLRGGYQSLDRSLQIIAYSNQLVGYVSTFAASARATAADRYGQRIVIVKGPLPSGYAALPTNLPYFRDGCACAAGILTWMNQRTVQPNVPTPGKLLFAGFGERFQHRGAVEDFFYESIILGRRRSVVMEELRVWAR